MSTIEDSSSSGINSILEMKLSKDSIVLLDWKKRCPESETIKLVNVLPEMREYLNMFLSSLVVSEKDKRSSVDKDHIIDLTDLGDKDDAFCQMMRKVRTEMPGSGLITKKNDEPDIKKLRM